MPVLKEGVRILRLSRIFMLITSSLLIASICEAQPGHNMYSSDILSATKRGEFALEKPKKYMNSTCKVSTHKIKRHHSTGKARSSHVEITLYPLVEYTKYPNFPPFPAVAIVEPKPTYNLRRVISLAGGAGVTSSVGISQTFPIANPGSGLFYTYTANQEAQTHAIFDGFVGVEWMYQPRLALQFGLGLNIAGNVRAKGDLLQGNNISPADQYYYQYSVLSRQLFAETKLLYQHKSCIHPYVLLGLGVAFNSAYSFQTDVPSPAFTRLYNNNTETSFTYRVGAGLDLDVTNQLRLGLGYRFTDRGHVQLGSAKINSTSVSGTLEQNHLYTNEMLAQLTWLF